MGRWIGDPPPPSPTNKPQPRAVVALSEDRQWLVVLVDGGWLIYRDRLTGYLVFGDGGDDTGQGAEDVLAAFLREREA